MKLFLVVVGRCVEEALLWRTLDRRRISTPCLA
jgi:hypothetical protein